MINHKRGDLQFLSYKLFDQFDYVTNIISTRAGGVSNGHYNSLNVGFSVGDTDLKVIENRELLCKGLDIELSSLVSCKQIHSSNVSIVNSKDKGKGGLDWKEGIDSSDGLITSLKDIPLFIVLADCAALSFLDPKHRIIALVHGSWRGTFSRIAQKTVLKMVGVFGSKKEDIIVGIGPSIGQCCCEVKEDFIELFNTAHPHIADKIFIQKEGSTYFDLCMANTLQLEEIGIRKENIELSGICNACNTDLFYSYRAEKGKTGRFCGLIILHSKTKRNY